MLCTIQAATLVGVDAVLVEVEVNVSAGLPGFHLVGLCNDAVREGAVRIRTAIENSAFDMGHMRVTVNLAPAYLRKYGSAFDLPIAIGALGARGLTPIEATGRTLMAGELALDGRLRPIRGALSIAECARRSRIPRVLVPTDNAGEAAIVNGVNVYGVDSLQHAVSVLEGRCDLRPTLATDRFISPAPAADFADVAGQHAARRAAEIAAAGGHNMILVGPPGSGKSMIAQRIAGILPPLAKQEAIETTRIHSISGRLADGSLMYQRPYRAPHHNCSTAGLIGGGTPPRPGEGQLGPQRCVVLRRTSGVSTTNP